VSRFPFTSFPQGWYVIGFSSDVAVGEVKTVHYLGHDIVLFRGASGVAAALDKTCPHLGAHLGGGHVDGDCLRCPFHHWAYDVEGRCVDVPYAPKIPPKAKVRRWPMLEQDGTIMVWYSAEGGEPAWTPPVLESEGWTPNRGIRWELKSHPQEIAENTVDSAHLGPVHHVASCNVRSVEQSEHTMRVLLDMVASGEAIGMPDEVNDVELDVTLHGLGQVISRTHVLTAGLRTRQRIHPTPIDGERVAIFGINNIKQMPDAGYTREIDEIFWAAFTTDFPRDFPIWENKAYLDRPLLAGGDGPIGTYRKWARQFYGSTAKPIEDAPAADHDELPGGFDPRRLLMRAVDRVRRLAASRLPIATPTPAPTQRATNRERTEAKAPKDAPRFASVDAYFGTLAQRFDAAAAGELDAVIQWNLSGAQRIEHFAEVKGGRVHTAEGAHERPTLTIEMSADDYLSMINGELNGAFAFSTGRGRLHGPVRLAMRMQKLFPLERQV
jgi:nitrite reductase/ring-hydroxylating ferredoxin subunit/putative sterol carrier protein